MLSLRSIFLVQRLTLWLGEGRGDSFMDTQQSQDSTDDPQLQKIQFAPSGLHARLRQRLGQPLKISVPQSGPVARIQNACAVRLPLLPSLL
jgi:hypothetical protein